MYSVPRSRQVIKNSKYLGINKLKNAMERGNGKNKLKKHSVEVFS